jgi:copper chaperone
MQTTFRITNITCESCVALSTEVLQELPGVDKVSIDIQTGTTNIEGTRSIPFQEIQKALAEVEKITAEV